MNEIDAKVERVRALVEQGLSRRAACREVGIAESTVRGRLAAGARAPEPDDSDPGLTEHPDGSLTVREQLSNSPPAPWNPEAVLVAHGRRPDEYVIVRERYNRWGDPGAPMHQLRFDAVPKDDIVFALDYAEWEPPELPPPVEREREARRFFAMGDQHCPYHDVGLHRAMLKHVREQQPELIVLMGDGINAERAGRHRQNHGHNRPTKDGIKAYGHIIRDIRYAAPEARIVVLRGNHDDWIEQRLLEINPDLADIETAFSSTRMHSLAHLLHLEDMGVELVDVDYNRGKFRITPTLTARHGYLAGNNTSDKTLQRVANSVLQAHTHRLTLRFITYHDDPDHGTVTRVAGETGCMCQIKDGLFYDDEPNWHQGYLTGWDWPGGDFTLAPNVYVHGRLLTADGRRYHPEA